MLENSTIPLATGLTSLPEINAPWTSVSAGALLVITTFGLTISFLAKSNRKLPPGPKGYPIVGNTFQMPKDRPWLQFTEWAKQYGKDPIVVLLYSLDSMSVFTGDVYSITYCGTPFIILNTAQACFDLLDTTSNIYSDRPNWIMASEIMAGGLRTLFMHYSDR